MMRRRSSQLPGSDLYGANRPGAFWRGRADAAPTGADWASAVRAAAIRRPAAVTAVVQRRVAELAPLDARLGVRSSSTFVPERYRLDAGLIRELRTRGFAVGGHRLAHDAKPFSSRRRFARRVQRINQHLRQL